MRFDKAIEVVVALLLGLAALFGIVASGIHNGAAGGWWWATKGCATGAVFLVFAWFVLHPFFVWARTQTGEWRVAAARRALEQAAELAAIQAGEQQPSRRGRATSVVVPAAPGELQVVHASYFGEGGGFDDRLADLLNRLRSENGQRLRFQVTNQVLGDGNPTYDPAPGIVKTLQITYVLNGESRTVQVPEGQQVDLP